MWVFMCVALKAPGLRRRIDVIVALESMIRAARSVHVCGSLQAVCVCVFAKTERSQ